MINRLRDIMSDFAVIIDELEEIKRVLQLQAKATREPQDVVLKSVLEVHTRLVERVLDDSYPLYNKIDYTIMSMKKRDKKK